jgi:predicted permease
MSSFILIFLCLGLGIFFRKFRIFPENAFVTLNRFVIYVSLPALTLVLVHRLEIGKGMFYPIAMPWIHFVASALFFYGAGRLFGWSKKTVGALILTAGLGNTSFVGFPLLEALYGKNALAVGVLVDQPGSFTVVSTLGIAIAALYSGGRLSAGPLLKKIFLFPPLMAVIVAFLTRPIPFHPALIEALEKLGATLVPLALISVGMQLRVDAAILKRKWRPLALGLGFKLFFMPAFFTFLYVVLLHQHSEAIRITLVESAMASMITSGVVAEEYGLDAELASLMIGIGIPISLITAPAWAWFFGRLF